MGNSDIKIVDFETESLFFDPRPDLGDSEKWEKFFQIARELSLDLAAALLGIRSQGAELGYMKTGGAKIVPVIDWNGWANEEEYKAAREKYLVPHGPQLSEALKILESSKRDDLPEGITEKESPWPDVTGVYVYVAKTTAARSEMHKKYPWIWIFNKGEVPTISTEPDPREALKLRGITGSLWANEKRKEEWERDNKPGPDDGQGVPADAKQQNSTPPQKLRW